MKRKQFTRLLSLLLALVLATGLVSPALAAESRVSDTLVPLTAEKVAEDELELAESMNVMPSATPTTLDSSATARRTCRRMKWCVFPSC